MVLATLGVSLMMPKIFESTATLLPQLESNNGDLALARSWHPVEPEPQLKAWEFRSLARRPRRRTFSSPCSNRESWRMRVIRKFNLMEHYETKTMQEARLELEGATPNRRQQRKGHQGHGRR